jgi:hypothetical protein
MDLPGLLSVVLTLGPYILYTCAYKVPSFLARFLTQRQLIEASQWMKLLCLACAVPTMYRAGINGAGMCIGLPLGIIGQYLSELVYSLLGDAGVYYGIELGTVKPRRISGFPFEISDPMYRGAILTVVALFLMFNITRDTAILALAWIIAYFYEICVENTRGGAIAQA